jgi:effector-binding domain-containing protein
MEIQQIDFGPRKYLVFRKAMPTDRVSDAKMYDRAFYKLSTYMKEHQAEADGPGSVIYFGWDEENHQADVGMAFPVKGLEEVNDPELSLLDVPRIKAVVGVHTGTYEDLKESHASIWKYIMDHQLDYAHLAIEEYVTDPLKVSAPEDLITKIYYLYK